MSAAFDFLSAGGGNFRGTASPSKRRGMSSRPESKDLQLSQCLGSVLAVFYSHIKMALLTHCFLFSQAEFRNPVHSGARVRG